MRSSGLPAMRSHTGSFSLNRLNVQMKYEPALRMVGMRMSMDSIETLWASSTQHISTPSNDLMLCALPRTPRNINSEPLRFLIYSRPISQPGSLYFIITSAKSLCTESAIEFCTSRQHRTRSLLCVANAAKTVATVVDLPDERPPW